MSGLAKVFIVVNFVLSIVFLSAAGMLLAKSDEYREAYENEKSEHDKTKTELNDRIVQLQGARDTLQKEYDKVTNDLNDERVAKEKYSNDLTDQRAANDDLRSSVNKLQANLDDLQSNLQQSANRVATLEQRVEQEQTRADEAVRKQMAAEDNLTRAQARLNDMQDRVADLEQSVVSVRNELEDAELKIEWAKSRGVTFDDIEAVPSIEGVVQQVDNDTGVMILSVGSDDGVKKGFKFYVYRGDSYLGEVFVDSVQADLSSAFARAGLAGTVRAGDQVTTRL